jgi:inosine-uridine nucleoside N-ribohydrolase
MNRSTPVIVDTDAGFDDFLAITFLLAAGVSIEAFTLVNGISDVDEGAKALLLLQQNAGLAPIPIYKGSNHPMAGANHFPDKWRHQATQIIDDLGWGEPHGPIGTPDAVSFLVHRLKDASNPVEILAIGPLTNIARAFEREPSAPRAVKRLTIMGGAVGVPGNIPPADLAEGNIYVDPLAAQIVLSSGVNPTFVPLNATSQVPITKKFIDSFNPTSTLGTIAKQILEIIAARFIKPHQPPYDAWDPLAAVALRHASVLQQVTSMDLEVVQSGINSGQTVQGTGTTNSQVAMSADADAFRHDYKAGFGS